MVWDVPKLTLESTQKTTLQVEHTIACLEGLLVDCRCASDLDAHVLWAWMEMITEILSRFTICLHLSALASRRRNA